jgi:hypothetical protein
LRTTHGGAGSFRHLAAVAALLPGIMGCVGLTYEREIDGSWAFTASSTGLEPGRTTLRDALGRLGPPELILRVGDKDRAYWAAWDADYLKFIVGLSVPIAGRSVSWDFYIHTWGGEDLYLVRMEFDRAGVLRDFQETTFIASRSGQYVSLDNRVVSTFIEDRDRMLRLVEEDDDDEDEDDARRKKMEKR